MLLWMMLTACNLPGCSQESILLDPVACTPESFALHHEYYDDRQYRWERACPGGAAQSGTLRVGAVMQTDKLGCTRGEGTCLPCLPELNGDCQRIGAGLFSGHLVSSGDQPLGAGYYLRCDAPEPAVAFFFQDEEEGPVSSCLVDSSGRGACEDECSLVMRYVPPAAE